MNILPTKSGGAGLNFINIKLNRLGIPLKRKTIAGNGINSSTKLSKVIPKQKVSYNGAGLDPPLKWPCNVLDHVSHVSQSDSGSFH